MNTTLIPTLPIGEVCALAEWQAKQALRFGRNGNDEGFAAHANKMYDILEAARYPYLTSCELVRHLGRGRAMVLKIERRIINLAL